MMNINYVKRCNTVCSIMPCVKNVLQMACFLSVVFYIIDVLFVPDFKTTTNLTYITSRTTARTILKVHNTVGGDGDNLLFLSI
jgi:hypothetical protein